MHNSGRASSPDQTTLWYCRVGGGENENDAAEWIKYEYDLGLQKCDAEGLVWRKIVIKHSRHARADSTSPRRRKSTAEFDLHPAIRVVAMGGLPRVVPPNTWGWCAHGCRFEMDGEHYQFFAYYYEDPVVTTGIALYRMK
jgi:hypothetical protein